MAQKITYWLLISLILSLGFGQLLRFDFYGLPLYLHDILVVCLLLMQILNLNIYKTIKLPSGLKLLAIALLISSLRAITLYPISSLLVPALYALRLLAYLALFTLLRYQKIKIPFSVFYISGLVTIFIGILQYSFMPDMRIFQYLGWDDHLSRLTLPHFDPTFTGVMICLFSLSLIGASVTIAVPTLVISTLAILLTYARSVWLSLLILGFMFIKNQKVLFVLVIGLFISVFLLPQRFGEGTNLLRTYSISSRVESDLGYVQKYNWDLVVGRGLNTMVLDDPSSIYDNHATGPNNSYLYLLVTTGVLGLVGWGMFMFSLYRNSAYKPMLTFFFIASLFNNVMFYPFALLWVLLLEAQSHT